MTAPDGRSREEGEPPGLQRERTLLAWTRTLLALVVVTALLVRVVGAPWNRPVHLPAGAALVVTLWLFVASDLRYRRGARGGPVTSPVHLGLVAVTASGLGAVGLVALVLG